MSALDDRLRSAADAVHQQTERLSIPEPADEPGPMDHRRSRSDRLLVVLAAAVVVVLVASVTVALTRGGGNGTSDGDGFSIEALAAATKRESARFKMTSTLPESTSSGQQSGQLCSGITGHCSTIGPRKPLMVLGSGLIDFRSGEGRIELESGTSNRSMTRFLTELFVDGHVYISIDSSTTGIPAKVRRTKRWIETDASTAGLNRLNPFEPLALFGDQHVELEDRGTTKLGGQTVHQYHGVAHMRVATPSSGPSFTVTSAFDIYVDNHNRLVRLRSVDTQPRVGPSTSQLDFSDYGVHVDVAAPPAEQVYTPPTTAPSRP